MSLFPISVRKPSFFLTSISYSTSRKIWSRYSAHITSFSSVVLCLLFICLFLHFLLFFNPRKLWHCLNHMFLKISISWKYSMLLLFAKRNLILRTFFCRLLKCTKGDRGKREWSMPEQMVHFSLWHTTSTEAQYPRDSSHPTDSRHPTDIKVWFSKS